MHRIVLGTVLSLLLATTARAQTFAGPYAGIEFGTQQVIGGSLVDGVDTLQEDRRAVFSAFGGLRLQAARFVAGGELGFGWLDGDLSLTEAARALTVDYTTGSQWHWQLHAGYAVADGTLIFGYLSEVTRSFDVTITQPTQTAAQQDEQGLLRFGAGLEQRVAGPLHLAITAGSSRADFGGRATNITPGRRFELAGRLVLQF